MIFELIGTLVAGGVMALLVWAVNRFTGGRLPKWLMPVAAGLAMLIATISSEYGWYARTTATMPRGLVVAQPVEERVFYRPWTYVRPYISRFVAVDRARMRSHPQQPDQYIADLVIYGRWARTATVPVLVDCAGMRRADLADGAEFGAGGEVISAQWIALDAGDPVLQAVCQEV
ncbi:hypothetical protein [Roseobacter sp.]|uniref:hypothetical protein n=1 Tax=Roseobacter sp. TaxID=1907202 RepID=UPI0025DD401E|nr:hypothetical protein [Roseobacter sp.]